MRAQTFCICGAPYLLAVGAVTLAQGLSAQPAYWDPAVGGNGHYYEVVVVPGGLNWWEARLRAASRGGTLAAIGSAAENSFVHSLTAARADAWSADGNNTIGPHLGGFRPDGSSEPSGGWQWLTGEPFTFTNWATNEPNNLSTDNALVFFGNGPTNRAPSWGNVSAVNASARGYVVEIDLSGMTGFIARNAATDFSAVNNPNAPWTYGWSLMPGNDFAAFSQAATASGLRLWRSPSGSDPAAIFNPTGADIQPGTTTYAAGKFHLCPGPDGEFAVLRFVCPVTGVYEINAAFEAADQAGGSTEVSVRVATNLWFQSTITGYGPATRRSYRGASLLSAGAVVDFAVGPNGSHANDNTRVDVQINYRRTFDGVVGEIAYAGEVDTYSFRLTAPATLYFDAHTASDAMSWSLTGPPGTVVNARTLARSDTDWVANPLLPLPAGDYTLSVRANGDATGPYQFKLLNLADATLISPGVTVANPEFERRTTDLYQFAANAGDILTFDAMTMLNGGSFYWRLVDPYGRIPWANYFSDVNNFTLPATGVYTLLLESFINGGSASSYSFRVMPGGGAPPPAFTGTPLTLGASVSNVIATAGATNAFTFSLGEDTLLYVDSLIYSPNLRYTLLGPGGIMASTRAFGGGAAGDLHRVPAGNYQLVVSGYGSYAGPFVFRLHDLGTSRQLTPGAVVEGTNTPANSLTSFRFNATPGTRVFFDALAQSGHSYFGNCSWTLVDPYGNVLVADVTFGDRGPMTLTGQGTYTLWVTGADQEPEAAGTFAFNLVPATETSTALALGTEYQGAIGTPSQRHLYTFSLNERKRVYFQSLTNQSQVRWTLAGPAGVVQSALQFSASGWLAYWLEPGDYQLAVFGDGDDIGGYRFKLVDFATSTPLAIGPAISGTVTPAATVGIWDLTLTAGERLYVDALSQSGFGYFGNPIWRLEDPEGNAVFLPEIRVTFERSFGDVGPFFVQRSGTYRLLVGGAIQEPGASGNFSFRILRVTNSTEAIAFNQNVEAAVSTPGQQRVYTFTLSAPAGILVDSLFTASGTSLRWTLAGQDRVYASGSGFNSQGWYMHELPAGRYELIVSAPGDDTGTVLFRLNELGSAAEPLPLNSMVNTTLTPPCENKVFKFAATAGQRVYFDVVSQSGFESYGNPYWLLVSPSGQPVFDDVTKDRGSVQLREAGEYHLVVSGHLHEPAASGTLAFRINDAPLNTAPLTFDALTTGELAVAGEWDRFTFTLGQSTGVVLDSRTNSPLRWTLSGPAGALVSERGFNVSDGLTYDSFNLLPPGDYTLDITGAGDGTGGYAFLLRTAGSGEALTLNATVSGALDPANATRLFRFNASAGDCVRFQALSQTGLGNAYWRLHDPAGDFVWGGSFSGGHSNRLERSGGYTLQLEGYIGEPGSGTFAFSTTTYPPVPPPALSGTPIGLGQIVSNALPTSATVESYLLTLPAPGRIYLDYLRSMDNFKWALIGPAGPVVTMRWVTTPVEPPLESRLLPAGAYELQLTGSMAPYAIRFLSVDGAPVYGPGRSRS